MEKFNSQDSKEYRDGLAESLSNKRNLDGGKDLAKEQLEMEKETVDYKRAEIQHKEDNLALKQDSLEKNSATSDTKESPELKALLEKAVFIKEIIPDPEITSAETAISKLEDDGYKISDNAKEMLSNINWGEKLNSSYEVVCIKGEDLYPYDKELETHLVDGIDGKTTPYQYNDNDALYRAKELGLKFPPQALIPSICINYPNGTRRGLIIPDNFIKGINIDMSLPKVSYLNVVFVCGFVKAMPYLDIDSDQREYDDEDKMNGSLRERPLRWDDRSFPGPWDDKKPLRRGDVYEEALLIFIREK